MAVVEELSLHVEEFLYPRQTRVGEGNWFKLVISNRGYIPFIGRVYLVYTSGPECIIVNGARICQDMAYYNPTYEITIPPGGRKVIKWFVSFLKPGEYRGFVEVRPAGRTYIPPRYRVPPLSLIHI